MKSVLLRETDAFRATTSPRGVRITSKEPRVEPQSRVVRPCDWEYLRGLKDDSFDGACVWDYGIGVFRRKS